jgi:hypothetical protein
VKGEKGEGDTVKLMTTLPDFADDAYSERRGVLRENSIRADSSGVLPENLIRLAGADFLTLARGPWGPDFMAVRHSSKELMPKNSCHFLA